MSPAQTTRKSILFASLISALMLTFGAASAQAQYPWYNGNPYAPYGRQYVVTPNGLVPMEQYRQYENQRLKLGVQGFAVRSGLKITYVLPGSIADRAGIEVGDVVVNVNGVRPHDYNDLYRGLIQHVGCAHIGIMDGRTGRLIAQVVHY